MLNFTFSNTTKIIFGRDAQLAVGKEVARWGKKVLLHYGGGHITRSGLKGEITNLLQAAGLTYLELGGVQPNPRVSLVREGIELCQREEVDFILAVGGGSVIDSAKAIAIGAFYEGDVWDFYEGQAQAGASLPLGVILTIPAAGSEASTASVLTKEEGSLKRGYSSLLMRPKFAILNPELTFSLPAYQTACGVADMMAHVFERYFTATADVGLTDELAEGTLRSIMRKARRVVKNPDDYGTRANLMWAGTIAHNGLLGTGRSEDWASHNIAHELSGIYDLAHGASLSIIFPAWMKYVYKHYPQRFLQFSARVMQVEPDFQNPERSVLEGIRRLEQFFREIGLPTSFQEAGLAGDRLEEMAAKCTAGGEKEVGALVSLQEEDVLNIYRLALGSA